MRGLHIGQLVIYPLLRTERGRALALGRVYAIRRNGASRMVDVEALLPPVLPTVGTYPEEEIIPLPVAMPFWHTLPIRLWLLRQKLSGRFLPATFYDRLYPEHSLRRAKLASDQPLTPYKGESI